MRQCPVRNVKRSVRDCQLVLGVYPFASLSSTLARFSWLVVCQNYRTFVKKNGANSFPVCPVWSHCHHANLVSVCCSYGHTKGCCLSGFCFFQMLLKYWANNPLYMHEDADVLKSYVTQFRNIYCILIMLLTRIYTKANDKFNISRVAIVSRA